jgi:hypothetical protein
MFAAEQPVHFVRNSPRFQRDMDEIFLRLLDSLCNGDGHLCGFAFADADPSFTTFATRLMKTTLSLRLSSSGFTRTLVAPFVA